MNEKKGVIWLYTLIATVIASVATTFYSILEKYYLEAQTGMYKLGAQTPVAFAVFMFIGVLILFFVVFNIDKNTLSKEIKGIPIVTSVISVLAATMLVFSAVLVFMENAKGGVVAESQLASQKVSFIFSFIAFPAALYYLLLIFSGKTKTKAVTIASFFPVIWTWGYLLSVYFDHSTEMSSPERVIQELAVIMLLLYQLMETRTLIGKAKPRMYILVSGLALIFLAPAFLSGVVDVIKKTNSLSLDDVYLLYGALMVVYVFTRMVGYAISCSGGEKKDKKHRKNDIFTEEDDAVSKEEKPSVMAEFFGEIKSEETDNTEETES